MKQTKSLRAISFGEMLTSRNLYIVLAIFAMGALAAFVTTGQTVNSTSSIQGTLSQPEATKIKIMGAQVTALANLPNATTATAAGAATAIGATATGGIDGTVVGNFDATANKIVVGIVGTNATAPFVGTQYKNDSTVYGTIDRGAATRYLFSTKDLGQDLTGFDYLGTGSVLGNTNTFIYKSVVPN